MKDKLGESGQSDPAGYISSDSSFYGDANDCALLKEQTLQSYDPASYWSRHPHSIQVIAAKSRATVEATSTKPLYNPYEGRICGRQLTESVEDFLQRLPPLTTRVSLEYPWLFVANPRAGSRPTDRDEAGFTPAAEALLQEFIEKREAIEMQMKGKAKGSITRKLTPLRQGLDERLWSLARETRFTSGKWMLFPYPADVNRQWAVIAPAVVNGELGTAAKVAPNDGSGDQSPRVICVYTEDFSDLDDVKRVLGRLAELGLAKKNEGGIYYKADAFTELGINAGNEWGLKPSLYSSKELLKGKK
ncbi:MAG: hypothetical protein LQ350_002488 [Teloschistes chrysophthalmus]|nr:MAG: hypothetical protein LQ350_002488 [Niorma chrysophthalma]